MKKRIMVLALLAVLLIGLTACSGKNAGTDSDDQQPRTEEQSGGDVSAEPAETKAPVTDDLPELKFEKEFNILSPEVSHCTAFVFAEELTGDNVNDAKYQMELAMEERFGIDVREEHSGTWNVSGNVKNLIAAGDTTYDISFCQDNVEVDHLALTYCLDDLQNMDFSNQYWDIGMNEAGRINGKAYFAYGAYHLSHYDMTHIITFSKGLVDSLNLENPYELVKNGAWTMDRRERSRSTSGCRWRSSLRNTGRRPR